MNLIVLELAQSIADDHQLTLRDVIARFRKAGVEFRTETNHTFSGEPKDEQVLLGYSFEGLFHPYSEEENRTKLVDLVVKGMAAVATAKN